MSRFHFAPCNPVQSRLRRRPEASDELDPHHARLAWEFLRRNPDYRADYHRWRAGAASDLSERWGLRAPLDPDLADVDPRLIWAADVPARHGKGEDRRAPEPRVIYRPAGSSAGSRPATAPCLGRSCPCDPRGCRRNA